MAVPSPQSPTKSAVDLPVVLHVVLPVVLSIVEGARDCYPHPPLSPQLSARRCYIYAQPAGRYNIYVA
jgi:hypothetical protein